MATKKKNTANEPPEPLARQPEMCRKCGGTDLVIQLRKVLVTVGWQIAQINAIAPSKMCMKCGNKTVHVDAVVGDLANLVPDPEYVKAVAANQGKASAPKKGAKKTAPKKPGKSKRKRK